MRGRIPVPTRRAALHSQRVALRDRNAGALAVAVGEILISGLAEACTVAHYHVRAAAIGLLARAIGIGLCAIRTLTISAAAAHFRAAAGCGLAALFGVGIDFAGTAAAARLRLVRNG